MLAAAIAGLAAWAWFEAGWLRRNVIDVELPGVPPELDGLRIAHLSDLHLGVPSRGRRAVRDAVEWVIERRPDLVCITGDLVSRRSGMRELERLLADLPPSYVVLGNHDFADSRDPFSQRVDPEAIGVLENVTLLGDESVEVELRGRRVQIVGVDAQSYAARTAAPDKLADSGADLRLLLCHFPGIVRRIPEAFHLILAGHYHAGQIVIPYPGGRLRLAHLRARDIEGVYEYGTMKLHVSAGLGTTFIPFRLFARPEVTELVVIARSRQSLKASAFAAAGASHLQPRVTIDLMEAPVISNEVLARYAGDAALEVEGVSSLARDAAEISGTDGSVEIDVHVELAWGAGAEGVAREVQQRVAEYIERMANVSVGSVDVVVERVGAPPAKR